MIRVQLELPYRCVPINVIISMIAVSPCDVTRRWISVRADRRRHHLCVLAVRSGSFYRTPFLPRRKKNAPSHSASSLRGRYGEIANINLVRDKKTGKSKGFCFLCYEDQRSTVLAVDNFNGIKVRHSTRADDFVAPVRF